MHALKYNNALLLLNKDILLTGVTYLKILVNDKIRKIMILNTPG